MKAQFSFEVGCILFSFILQCGLKTTKGTTRPPELTYMHILFFLMEHVSILYKRRQFPTNNRSLGTEEKLGLLLGK